MNDRRVVPDHPDVERGNHGFALSGRKQNAITELPISFFHAN